MANKIILKKSSVAAKAPVAGDLDFGELAINYTDSKLYFKKADGSIDAFTSAAASAPVTSVGGNIGAVTDAQLLASIKNVDGAGSGLDADFLDGNHASAFYLASNPNGYTSNTGTVTSVGATAPLVSSLGNTPSISIPAATASANGYMSSAYAAKLDGIAAGATNVTNTNQLTNGAGYITSAALGSYLPLTGGTLTGSLFGTTITAAFESSNARFKFKAADAYSGSYAIIGLDWGGAVGTYKNLAVYDYVNGRSMVEFIGDTRAVNIFGTSTVSTNSWAKWVLETIGTTAKARQGSDSNGLNFTSNALWNGAWVEDDTTKKKFAYIQHLGNGRHEFRTAAAGAGISWVTSLTIDDTAVNSSVALTQGGNQVLHAGNVSTYALPITGGSLTGPLNVNRRRLSFSSSYNDSNHSIYNNYENIDGEGVWDGMKMNVYNGLRVRVGNASGTTPIQAFGIDSSGNSDFYGNIKQGNNFAHPNVEWSASGTSTGEVIFYLPGTTSNYGMVHMVFDIYEYNSNNACTVIIGGHNWSTSWYNTGVDVIGYTNKSVRLGVKDGRFVVVFGVANSTWSYGTIRLRKVHNGLFYNNTMDLNGNWGAVQTTTESFSNISGDLRELRTSNTMYAYAYRGHSNVDGTGEASYHPAGVYSIGTNWLYGSIITNNNSINAGTGTVEAGRVYGYTDIRSPIFYDNNDTSYYIDPNSTTTSLNLRGEIRNPSIWINDGDNSNGYNENIRLFNAPNGVSVIAFSASGISGTPTTSILGYSDRMERRFSDGWQDRMYNGYVEAAGSYRAPIFYDSNSTGYYLDPNSISSLRTVGSWRSDSSAWDGEFSGKIQYHSNNWYFQAAGEFIWRNSGGSNVIYGDQSGNHWATASSRSPIFYDNNNTGYYTDPNGSSRLGTVNADTLRSYNNIYLDNQYGSSIIGVYSSVRYQGVFSMGDSYKLAIDGTTAGNLYGIAWSHPNAGGVAGNLNTHGALILENGSFLAALSGSIRSRDDMRSPIFYDSNNTGYYNDPASVSYLYGLTLAGGSYFRPQNWIQLDGSYGLYWPNHYGAHLHANDLSTYTQIALRGGKNSYGGIYDQYSGVNIGMYDSSGNGGVYRENSGRWFSYYNVGNDCWGFGTSSTSSAYNLYAPKGIYSGGRVDGTIFYDSNNTGYYADLNGTTYLYYLQSATTVRADSDRRLKENITPITSALSLVRQLQGCRYTRNDLADKTKVYIGMIAQDVLNIVPEVVSGSEAGKYSLGYAELVPVLNEAVKELDEIVSKQAAIIAKLEERLSKLLDD